MYITNCHALASSKLISRIISAKKKRNWESQQRVVASPSESTRTRVRSVAGHVCQVVAVVIFSFFLRGVSCFAVARRVDEKRSKRGACVRARESREKQPFNRPVFASVRTLNVRRGWYTRASGNTWADSECAVCETLRAPAPWIIQWDDLPILGKRNRPMVDSRGWVLCETRFLSSRSSRHFSRTSRELEFERREILFRGPRSKGCKLLIIFDPAWVS